MIRVEYLDAGSEPIPPGSEAIHDESGAHRHTEIILMPRGAGMWAAERVVNDTAEPVLVSRLTASGDQSPLGEVPPHESRTFRD